MKWEYCKIVAKRKGQKDSTGVKFYWLVNGSVAGTKTINTNVAIDKNNWNKQQSRLKNDSEYWELFLTIERTIELFANRIDKALDKAEFLGIVKVIERAISNGHLGRLSKAIEENPNVDLLVLKTIVSEIFFPITYKFVYGRHGSPNGFGSIEIRLIYNRKPKYVRLCKDIPKQDWDEDLQKVKYFSSFNSRNFAFYAIGAFLDQLNRELAFYDNHLKPNFQQIGDYILGIFREYVNDKSGFDDEVAEVIDSFSRNDLSSKNPVSHYLARRYDALNRILGNVLD